MSAANATEHAADQSSAVPECPPHTGYAVRAVIATAHVEWVRFYHGPMRFDGLSGELSPQTNRELLMMRSDGWISRRTLVELDRTIESWCGRLRADFQRELGRYSAHYVLTHGAVPRYPDAEAAVHGLPELHRRLANFGSIVCEQGESGRLLLRHHEFGEAHPELCLSAAGFYEQYLIAHGAHDVLVRETDCATRGAAECAFAINWTSEAGGV